ncbi:HxlR family transcriptional regulator [Planotetraspora silvatica]|uniref:HxlR family transcriptional regulator n=1 Tax=Planotetraspora silvatica TaxID=234614 RepID=A0A8J3UNZ3_9ACTN|nr:helix-turn-helix domain-containing protein [Planotetraspora silvatica]GII46756.1 HxlR family transcriptional regulator [Planotetraspora silvatica]
MTKQVTDGMEPAEVKRTEALAAEIFTDIANKWALLIINTIGESTLRFTELCAAVEGISHKMLAQTLRILERDGVVDRLVYPTVPPRVDYSLTDAGLVLRTTVNALCIWTRQHVDHIDQARQRFDERQARPSSTVAQET